MVEIPEGSGWIGALGDDKFANDTERPPILVNCRGFFLGRAPVTVGEFRHFRPDHEPGIPPDWPVAWVSWLDAMAYCRWLGDGYRLPTEAEWEFACRAGSRAPFFCGEALTSADANYLYDENGKRVGPGHRTPPGTYPPNAFGLLDMAGNVNEWVEDCWHPSHAGKPSEASQPAEGDPRRRVLRGGSWDYLPRLLRSCWRDWLFADCRRDNVGFRVARDLE